MTRRKICVVTGTRAEYGILYWLMKEIDNDPDLELQIIATGMHLSPEFGLTYKIIETDGFVINEKVEMLLSSDTAVGVAKSIGLATIGFADALDRLNPDLLVVLGDRYEILAVAQAALIAKIPIAHIGGGDLTEGVFDEAIRHSITKMSHLHFVTNDGAKRRVLQLGENPEYVFNLGNPGIDQIKRLALLSREDLEQSIDFTLRDKNVLVTFHPVTLEHQTAADQFQELLDALDELGSDVGVIITKPNSDTDGRRLIAMIDEYAKSRDNVVAFTSLGQLRYLSAVAHIDAVVGNSSSGLCEVPSFKKPTVNIGDRQGGRLQATSILNCEPVKDQIVQTIREAFATDCSDVVNPYGEGNSSERILAEIKRITDCKRLLKKQFFEVGVNHEA